MVAYYPKTILEALAILKGSKDVEIVAGGTDVMVKSEHKDTILFLNSIEENKKISVEKDILKIGAGCTYTELINNEDIPEILKDAMRKIAAPAIRNAGTLAGNICNASPAGDSLPVLYALAAKVVVEYLNDKDEVTVKRVPIEDFILGIRKIALKKEAMVTTIEIETNNYRNITKAVYEKVAARNSQAISKVSFIGLLKLKDEIVEDIRFAFGSVSTKVVRVTQLESDIIGLKFDQLINQKQEVVKAYLKYITPIDDQRSTAEYRKRVCENLLSDFLTKDGEVI